jgi:hypothetical protein
MSMYDPVIADLPKAGGASNSAPPTQPSTSETRLIHHVMSFRAKCENAQRRVRRSPVGDEGQLVQSGEDEQRKQAKDEQDHARRMELNSWFALGCISKGIDTGFTEILSYYKVRE